MVLKWFIAQKHNNKWAFNQFLLCAFICEFLLSPFYNNFFSTNIILKEISVTWHKSTALQSFHFI
jgi:hypothetical protein